MNIRSATAADVVHVLPMVEQIVNLHATWDRSRFEPNDHVLDSYRHWLRDRAEDARSVFLVAEQSSRVVAFLIGTVEEAIPIYRTQSFGFIHDIWVEPSYRHEGLARSMTLLAMERFKAIGVTQVRLETAIANDAARSLFNACGFRMTTQEMLAEL